MPDNKDKPATSPWIAVFSLTVACFVMVTTEFLPIGLLTNIAPSLNVSTGTAGLMVTMPGIVAAVAAPVLSLASGSLDRRLLMLGLSLLLVVSNLVSALAVNFPMMLTGRVLLGICVGGFWSFSMNYGRHLVPEASQGRAVALIVSGVSIGAVCGVPAGALIGDLFGWRSAFFASAGLAAITLLAQLRLLTSVPPGRPVTVQDLLSPLRLPMARIGLIAIVLLFVGHFSAYTYLRPLLQQVFVLSPSVITFQLLAYGAVGLLGTFIGERLAEHSLRATFILVTAMLAIILIVSPLLSGLAGATVMVLVWGLAFGAVPVCATNWMFEAVPDAPEAGQSLLVTVIQIALASGALLGGEVVDWHGVSSAMLFGGALMLSATLVFGLSLRTRMISAKQCG
ncbi:MFS transporter [Cedecea neteri]|uniref:Transporter n=1 Tax=Cedecea neteri TaxID=158822 RepID=A0AAN0S2F5_9ENTR|nr:MULTISPECIES: MFS transporter [Cedecea]NIG79603.1 MFS transporter [Klebsiella sp. Ap-873]AIR60017.1 transporter [Cedecea neteri]AIR64435.1 transporter [Cedecea neteri]WNJ79641.1 MFS transporter [Cedecea neteri]SMG53943.1 Predicted arabinose efflux permease, MFS family [Cedecea sp. NFIX57]